MGLFLLSACGDSGPTIVDVSLSEWAIEILSDTDIRAGEVTFNVTNNGALEHNFTIEGIDEAVLDLIYQQETQSLTVTLEPGTYLLVCTIEGHHDAGMELEITVVP